MQWVMAIQPPLAMTGIATRLQNQLRSESGPDFKE